MNTLYTTDRQRKAIINGQEVEVQEYMCKSCKGYFILPVEVQVNYCPHCGVKFDNKDDISL